MEKGNLESTTSAVVIWLMKHLLCEGEKGKNLPTSLVTPKLVSPTEDDSSRCLGRGEGKESNRVER
jgi:hypothetical protein